jgi:O-antigen ligase
VIERLAFLLLCLLAFTIPWEKSVVVAGIGTVAKAAGSLALAAGVIAAAVRRNVRTPNLAMAIAACFIVWSGLTWFWSADSDATLARSLTFVQLFILLWLVWDLCRTMDRSRIVLACYVAGACVASGATLVRFVQHLQTYYLRYAAPGFDPNDLGVTVALAIPPALYLAALSRGVRAWLFRGAVVLCGIAVLLTASRTALIATAVSFAFVFATWRSSGWTQRLSGIALLVLLGAGMFALAPKASRQRISTIGSEIRRGTLHKRTTIWKAGIRAWKSRKLTGVGSGAYPDAVRPIIGVPGIAGHEYVAHNTFLSVMVETGAIGFVLYFGFLCVLATFASVMRGQERVLWAVLLVVWAIGASTLTWEHRKPAWLLFGLLTTQWACAFRSERTE